MAQIFNGNKLYNFLSNGKTNWRRYKSNTRFKNTRNDIAEAKELPAPPPAEVTRMEYDMKDQLIRQTIMTTQEDVKELKEDLKRIEEKLDELR